MTRSVLVALLLATAACAQIPLASMPRAETSAVDQERAGQNEALLRAYNDEWGRYRHAALPIMIANADLCRAVGRATTSATGLRLYNLNTWGAKLHDTAERLYGADDRPRVLDVVDRTPAAQAGVRRGDAVVEYAGVAIGAGPDAMKRLDAALAKTGPGSLVVERDGQRVVMELQPVEACAYVYQMRESEEVDAFTNGDTITITRGMIHFATNDELSVVVGHELAHNVRRHVEAKKSTDALQNFLTGFLGRFGIPLREWNKIQSAAASQDLEREADYVGLYLTARAGAPVEVAPGFWRKMGVKFPTSIERNYLSTHPSSAERAASLEATVREIKEKMRAGAPLVANETRIVPAATPSP